MNVTPKMASVFLRSFNELYTHVSNFYKEKGYNVCEFKVLIGVLVESEVEPAQTGSFCSNLDNEKSCVETGL